MIGSAKLILKTMTNGARKNSNSHIYGINPTSSHNNHIDLLNLFPNIKDNKFGQKQIVFYDEIRYAKSCKKLKLKDIGYSCKKIENQIIK